jgi:hypothetical protein
MTHFDKEAECIQELAARLEARSIDPTLARAVAEALSEELMETQRQGAGFGLVIKRWAIRDDDLKLLDAIASGTLTAVGVAAGGPVAGAVAGACVAVVKLLWAAHRNGIAINQDQQLVMMALKAHKTGCTEEQLSEWLSVNTSVGWSPDRVRTIVTQLEKIARRDGTVVAVTQKDSMGRWRASGV